MRQATTKTVEGKHLFNFHFIFFRKFRNSKKKTADGGWCYQAGSLGILDCMVLYVTPIRLGLSC